MPRSRPSRDARDRMPAVLACLVAMAGLLAVADLALDRLPRGGFGLRPTGMLAALGGSRRARADTPPAPVAVPPSATSRATLGRINRLFVEAAAGTRRRLRIAYLGDSLIEGDLITSELRAALQGQLGGRGVGLVPLAHPNAHVRDTIRATAGPGWAYQHLTLHGSPPGPYALNGGLALAPADPPSAWVRFEEGLGRWRGDLPAAWLYYGRQPSSVLTGPVTVRIRSARGESLLTLTGTGAVNRVRVQDGPSSALDLAFTGAANLPLYGVSFESPTGVLLDSFALRGSVGNELVQVPDDLLAAFQSLLGYDIVVLHFGVNALYDNPADYRRYRRSLRATIEHLSRSMPGTLFLVVSASDRGWRGPDGLGSHPHVPFVVEAQRGAADDTGVAFFDLYRAMGAPGAMVRWAGADPPLARKDFTHFNVAGAREIARMVKKHLIGGERALRP